MMADVKRDTPKQNLHQSKSDAYFQSARQDMIEMMDGSSLLVLDIGCGAGQTGAVLKSSGKASFVAGIELVESAAQNARLLLDEVICGDIEKIELDYPLNSFDFVLFGDVLEHTLDPWSVLKKVLPLLSSTGAVLASLPNVRHWAVLTRLIFGGDWEYAADGILDQGHLRFFTRKSALRLFEQAGYTVVESRPYLWGPRSKLVCRFSLGLLTEFMAQRWLLKSRPL